MPDEAGTKETRSDSPSADDSPFGDVADDNAPAAVEEEDSAAQTEQDGQGSGDAAEQDAETEAAQDQEGSDDAGNEDGAPGDLRVVISIKGSRAVIGVQQPSSDPHIETFDDLDESGLTQEVPAVIDRARARWEDNPKHPDYARPVPVRSRSRRGQGSAQAQATTAEGEEAQQAALRLF